MRRSLHGLAVVEVDGRGPRAEQAMRWLRELPEADPGEPADIVWHTAQLDDGAMPDVARNKEGRWECWGGDHNLLLMLQDVLLGRDATLLHAAGLDLGGRGVLVIGPAGDGKTAAVLAALEEPGVRVLSDDLVVMQDNGRLLALPTPVAIRPGHRTMLPPLALDNAARAERGASVVQAALQLPGMRAAARTVRNRVASGEGPLGAWARRVKDGYMAVPFSDIVSTDRQAADSWLDWCVVLTRGRAWRMTDVTAGDAGREAMAATYGDEGMGTAADRYAGIGLLDLAEHRERAEQVVSAGLAHAQRITRVEVPLVDDLAVLRSGWRRLLAAGVGD